MARKGSSFAGVSVAMVTPLKDGEVDYQRLKEHVEFQIAGGTTCLCPVGTTGESPTLSHDEHERVISEVVQAAAGRLKVMAGTGSNSTAEALRLTRWAAKAGADGALMVAPYYNKPTQEGFYQHFLRIAEEVALPICVYNIPGRTGKNMAPETIARLAELENIALVKEATGSLDQASQILNSTNLTVLSGDDSLTLPLMSIGGEGVISVAANIVPHDMCGLVQGVSRGRCRPSPAVAPSALSALPRHARPGHQPDPHQSRDEAARPGQRRAAAADDALGGRRGGGVAPHPHGLRAARLAPKEPAGPKRRHGPERAAFIGMAGMPKLLLLCEYPSLNGGERSLLAVLDHLRQSGFELGAAAPPSGPLADALVRHGAALAPLPWLESSEARPVQREQRRQLRRLIADSAANIVHANSLSMSRLSGPVVEELGVPSIGYVRDIVNVSAAAVADINRHRRLLAVSHAARDWHVARGLAAEKTHVLYNGVDLDRFCPRPRTGRLHRELGLPDDAQLVGAVGQIGIRKGLDVLAEAAALVAVRAPRAHFVIVGQRHSRKPEAIEFEAALRQTCSRPPLDGRVHFLGPRCDVERLLNELTLLAHAARQEPLGRVLLEAAAAGTPVVATRVGGAEEIFPAGSSAAMLVGSERPAEVAAAILELLSDPRLRRRLGRNGRRRAVEAFDAQQSAHALAEHYREVMEARRSGGCGDT